MDTVRIELEGDYALVLKELRHKTSREVGQILRRQMRDYNMDIPSLQKAIEAKTIDSDETTECILLNQVHEWSFGTVNQEVLDNIPTIKYLKLATEVDKLYSAIPLAGSN
jgi:hypothetical protein